MRRRPEAYHATLRSFDETAGHVEGEDAPASIHDTVRVKEAGLAARIVYDAYERRSGLVRVLAVEATPDEWATARAEELGDVVDGAFVVETLETGRLVTRRAARICGASVTVIKTITLGGDRRAPTLTLRA